MARKQKLELTWIGKENKPRLESRILQEDRPKAPTPALKLGQLELR